MSEMGNKTQEREMRIEKKQRLNAEYLLEEILHRKNYTSATMEEVTEFLTRIASGAQIRTRSSRRREYVDVDKRKGRLNG